MNNLPNKSKKFNIAHITSQIAPFSKTGGMADVVNALSKKQSYFKHNVMIFSPYYGFIRKKDFERETIAKNLQARLGEKKYSFAVKKVKIFDNANIYFICNDKMFGTHKIYGTDFDGLRFYFFELAVLQFLRHKKMAPHIIHCHDWHAGLIPNLIRKSKFFAKTATVFTIHNLVFQGAKNWWETPTKKKDSGRGAITTDKKKIEYLNFTKRGILYSDVINTVSERHAKEILTSKYGQGLEKLLKKRKDDVYGIINGIDYKVHNPKIDKYIYRKYDWDTLRHKKINKLALQKELKLKESEEIPLIGFSNRLSEQKGIILLQKVMDTLLKLDLQFVIVGDRGGTKEYINFFKKVARKHHDKLAIYLKSRFPEYMESKMFAASDMFLMPSRFEPCGISQMKSLRYGSIPIVHKTGGLSDTIENFNPRTRHGNGFVFDFYNEQEFLSAIIRALENYKYPSCWEYLTWRSMKLSFSWELPAKKYLQLYKIAIKKRNDKDF
ncbi:MAG: glycogen/starch synthase [Patescibacteria group bacterium]|nr:glycogen/starch synthase [Patescibacteria group bacterium]